MAAPTSALTFADLKLAVAKYLGLAYYGANGDEAAQIPTDVHDLAEIEGHVNTGLRMFFNDAPPTGWRFARAIMELSIFGDVDVQAGRTVSGGAFAGGETVLTSTAAVFYPAMEYHTIALESSGSFKILRYISETQVAVQGDASTVSGETFSIATDGNFTLPASFAGAHTGTISYAADTNEGLSVKWVGEGEIRKWREDITDDNGDPWMAAVRPMSDPDARTARRWELLTYPKPDEVMVIHFPYDLHFDKLTTDTESPPTPYSHDETLRMAVLAAAERDSQDQSTTYYIDQYQMRLEKSHNIDNRSGPRRLGYNGNPEMPEGSAIRNFRNNWYDRPTVPYNG